jgi:hypothetical protein
MAAATSSVSGPPHPSLQVTSLFISPLPSSVLEEQVTRIFEGFYPAPTLTFTHTKNGRNRGALRPHVEFFDLNSGTGLLGSTCCVANKFPKPKRRWRYIIYGPSLP